MLKMQMAEFLGLLKFLEEMGEVFGANTLQQLRIFLKEKIEFANLRDTFRLFYQKNTS